jgi:hypothetical protein
VGDTGENFLQYFIAKARAKNITVDLSFGGAVAGPDDMVLPSGGEKAAQNLVTFMSNYSFDRVDFDLEGSGATYIVEKNDPDELEAFFTTLHTELAKVEKEVVITVEGSIQNGPEGTLKSLFQNYASKFDGSNLMLYSQSQYYIDAVNETWGITEWISTLKTLANEELTEAQIISGLHIGFYDSIDYTNPASSAGEQYEVPAGLTNGAAASYVFQQMEKELQTALPDMEIEFGAPFLWTDTPQDLPTNTFMEEFFNELD